VDVFRVVAEADFNQVKAPAVCRSLKLLPNRGSVSVVSMFCGWIKLLTFGSNVGIDSARRIAFRDSGVQVTSLYQLGQRVNWHDNFIQVKA
jgi:hypothetical protein